MASSSVSQEDRDVEHDFAIASRRAKVRSARAANRGVNVYSNRGDDAERDIEEASLRYEPNSVVLVEQNDASPKPICRGISKEKRPVARGGHAPGKNNKGIRDRRKLREKRRSTGVMHVPSTESTGGSTGEDENNENSSPVGGASAKSVISGLQFEEKVIISGKQGRSESDLDADDEANNSGDVRRNRTEITVEGAEGDLKSENERLMRLLEIKDSRISSLELQMALLMKQISDVREENAKLLRAFSPSQSSGVARKT